MPERGERVPELAPAKDRLQQIPVAVDPPRDDVEREGARVERLVQLLPAKRRRDRPPSRGRTE
jgi:hypothetical protein